MNKEKLEKFVYILLRERLTFGDMESILDEVENLPRTHSWESINSYVEETVKRLLKSDLKCYDNMCNTEEDDVQLVQTGDGLGSMVPMCADCRKRNQVVAVRELKTGD